MAEEAVSMVDGIATKTPATKLAEIKSFIESFYDNVSWIKDFSGKGG